MGENDEVNLEIRKLLTLFLKSYFCVCMLECIKVIEEKITTIYILYVLCLGGGGRKVLTCVWVEEEKQQQKNT